jgi:hypothetical protein
MNNPALPHAETAGSRSGAFQRHGKSARKNFPLFKLRNPLKSLDSDEGIQENPAGAFAAKRPRTKKTQTQSTGPTSRPAADSQTDSHPMQSALEGKVHLDG